MDWYVNVCVISATFYTIGVIGSAGFFALFLIAHHAEAIRYGGFVPTIWTPLSILWTSFKAGLLWPALAYQRLRDALNAATT